MKDIIEKYKGAVIQIATPYSTGTGFYLENHKLIVTNEHVVRGNKKVIVDGKEFEKQFVNVIYTDEKYDIAFLDMPKEHNMPLVIISKSEDITEGDSVIAVGHPFGLKYTATQGIISSMLQEQNDIRYLQHDAALNPGNSGGPLIDRKGSVVGINTFIIRDGNKIGFSLPHQYLNQAINDFEQAGRKIGVRCHSCSNLVVEDTIDNSYCPFCGTKLTLPSAQEEYEPTGVKKTIEDLLSELETDVALSRRGPNNWEIKRGSASIRIAYHEQSGLIIGDAVLVQLPKKNIKEIYAYLLRQNYLMEGLTFSVKGKDIILSLLIYDRYLNHDTGRQLVNHLFDRADYFDNILVEQFGAEWKND